ncbi:type II toxin-antitoxin system prevent-host-death family antitoxin [Candidatus Azambacteria bacterium]|nr:type II toxin-antitoxin system prevent-host-death family antitoxin [Candidatus Azambacteria bacterium]
MEKNRVKSIIGVKELRENLDKYISEVNNGRSFTVVRRSEPVFRIIPFDDNDKNEQWENIIDFTKIKKGGVPLNDIRKALSRLNNGSAS